MSGLRRFPAPIEEVIEAARWDFARHLYRLRCRGLTYAELAEANRIHRSTARLYVKIAESAARADARNGSEADQPPSCNALRLACIVCQQPFTASRGDARYCSSACRQDAYRKRKLGAIA